MNIVDRQPVKRWQVHTATECVDRRSEKTAYDFALGLANQGLSSEVWHWENGRWGLYERVGPSEKFKA